MSANTNINSIRSCLSDASTLNFGTWNCQGLSKIKKNIALNLNKDIICLTETHSWRDNSNDTIYSDPPPENDSWSGVALLTSNRVSKYIIAKGRIGSRIVYCRLKGNITNYFIIGVYIPRRAKENPNQNDIYNDLEKVLQTTKRHECVVIMGDFNSRLSRNESGFTGRWCIHKRRDSGGDRLLDIMKQFSLRCVSTYFQPPRRHSNATFINIQPNKPPSQIDYIIVSQRWSSSVRNCTTKWGPAISAYGRKYDHATVSAKLKIRLKTDKRKDRKDFNMLKDPAVARRHEDALKEALLKIPDTENLSLKLQRLNTAMQAAQSTLPKKNPQANKKWNISSSTQELIDERSRLWEQQSADQRKQATKNISRSVRNDYRNFVDSLVTDMEKAYSVGKHSEIIRLAKQLSGKGKTTSCTQPSRDDQGNPITDTDQQLELWANFLEKKFSAGPEEPEVFLHAEDEAVVPLPALEETAACVKKLNKGKAAGPDGIPIEQYQSSQNATEELHKIIVNIFETENIPNEFVTADMMMLYKKKSKDLRSNYRALGLLNHSYKTFSTVLLVRMLPFIEPRLSDMQAGFRTGRGCRDNILILTMAIQHLLKSVEGDQRAGVLTYIDFVAAFDSIYHSYMLQSLKEYGVPLKYVRLVRAIYEHATVRVRIQEQGGHRSYSRFIPIRRGAIQGDIPSSVIFLVALDRLLKEHGGLEIGLRITDALTLSDLEFADNAALANEDTPDASERMTNLSEHAKPAGMEISVPKTFVQHIMHRPKVSPTTETDIANLPKEKQFKFECEGCGTKYPTHQGMAIHRTRFCKQSKTAKKPSRRGTVADRIITRIKVEDHQKSLPVVKMGDNELQNVYSAVYLGAEIAGDGDQKVTFKHRNDIAWSRFNDYRTTLTSSKLPIKLRLRFYTVLIVSTLIYGSSAWLFDENLKRRVNGVNSKMTSSITKRSIHNEAREPSFNIINFVLQRRRAYLGHILRMDPSRMVRRFLLELNPASAPFIPGSLLDDTDYRTAAEMIDAASNRVAWNRNLNR